MQEAIISLKGVHKFLSGQEILKGINLEIKRGEVIGLVGINGSGKTTLIKTLVNFYKPDRGTLQYQGVNYNQVKDLQKKFGIATQEKCFYPKLTIQENVSHFGRLYGMTKEEIDDSLDNTLKLVNLYHLKELLASKLSGGMQRRIDIACSMVHSPQVIILDEPTSDLDTFLRKEILGLLKLINEAGITVVVSSHNLLDIEEICDRVCMLHQGRIIKLGTPHELKEEHAEESVIRISSDPGNYSEIIKAIQSRNIPISDFVISRKTLVIKSPQISKVIYNLLIILEKLNEYLLDFNIQKSTLEDIFEKLVIKENEKGK